MTTWRNGAHLTWMIVDDPDEELEDHLRSVDQEIALFEESTNERGPG